MFILLDTLYLGLALSWCLENVHRGKGGREEEMLRRREGGGMNE